tara:strand:+ start:4103 stop:5299 length:1197 start_codon:yes stop_codon:yes gene_type:complete
MAVFAVRTIKPEGGEEIVRLEAKDSQTAAAAAAARGLTPISVSLARDETAPKSVRGAAKLATRLAREMSVLTAAGLSVEPALAALSRHASDAKLKDVAQDLLDEVRSGKALSEAFAAKPHIFPAPFPEIAQAGEAGGALGKALGQLADSRERREAVESSIKGALYYPAFLMVIALGAIIAILVLVIPRFEGVLQQIGAETPPAAAFVFGAADAVTTFGPYVLVAIVAAIFAFRFALERPGVHEVLDRQMLNLPGIGKAMKTIIAARFCRVLALLLQNGISAAPALQLSARAAGNRWAVHRLTEALGEVRAGSGFSDRIEASDVLPELAAELLSVGEEAGDLGSAAERLATFYETRFESGAKAISSLIEPAVIMITGLVIGLMIMSILSALVSVNNIGL